MLPPFDTTLLYHLPDHLTAPDAAERVARAKLARKRLRITVWLGTVIRAAFRRPQVTHKA